MTRLTLVKKIKVVVFVVASLISGLGSMLYGFQFALVLEQYSHFLSLLSGGFLAITALLANAALGTYSLLNARIKQELINPYFLASASFISAIPIGFIGYFGYEESLPFLINLLISSTIVIVNAAIGYTAIYNFIANIFNDSSSKNNSLTFHLLSKGGFIVGVLVSTVFYIVTVHGLTHLLSAFYEDKKTAFHIACVLAVFSWIPGAALYSNSTKITGEGIGTFLEQGSKKITISNKFNLIILLVAIGSGASLCQIVIEFFDPAKDIPSFIKNDIAQTFIYYFIAPCAFVSSAAVNYLALKKLYWSFKESHAKTTLT